MQKIAVLVLCGVSVVAAADRMPMPQQHTSIPEPLDRLVEGGPGRPPVRPVPQPRIAPPEVKQLAKERAGTWSCEGAYAGTLEIKASLDGAWLQRSGIANYDGLMVKFTELETFDAVAGQWTRIAIWGKGHPPYEVWTSLGDDHGTWTWASGWQRQVERADKDTLEIHGKALASDRLAWQKTQEATCSKQVDDRRRR